MARRRLLVLAAAASFLISSCASHRDGDPLPTLEDYSDGVSVFAEAFLGDWKAGAGDATLYAAGFRWRGPLPGDALEKAATRSPLELSILRNSEAAGPTAGTAAVRARFGEIRSRFASLGRCENVLFDFRRKGDRREVVFGLLLTGRGADGALRQEGGKIRAVLSPAPGTAAKWRLASASLDGWLSARAAEPLFEETAARAGLARIHRAFLPDAARNVPVPGEHMPPGAAVLDYDGDGHEDLFVVGGDGNRLYRNRGDGTYEDATEKAGVGGQPGEAVGALAFDSDNDARPDLYVTYLDRPNRLYRNRGDGTFEEIGKKAGVALVDYCTSAAAIDYDRDGWPDLYVLVYGRPGHGPNVPADNAPPNHLFHNNGDGTFTDVSKAAHADDTGWGLALESADLDGDGWPDIYVANDFGKNTYLRNNGDGTFTDLGKKAGVLDPGFGMGVAIDDYDGDGRLDFYVSNYSFPFNWFLRDARFPMPEFPYGVFRPLIWRRLKALSRGSSLFRARGDGTFERTSDEAGVWDTSWSWGCVFVDADLDGRPDLFVVNGMVTGKNAREREIDFWNLMSSEYKKFEKGIPTADFGDDSLWGRPPKRFYRNRDGRHFDELAAVTGLESDGNQRGLVVTDADGDGAPDLFATGFLQPPALWINRNPSKAKTLVVDLEGDFRAQGRFRSTRDALGAIVTVEVGGIRRAQVVAAGYSFLSSGSRSLFFGLGDRGRADRVTVRWPSGRTTERRDVAAGKLRISEAAPRN
ncbi:MAG TPA: CRTAC1 family protein [Thermoanaerobaculia bacterium]